MYPKVLSEERTLDLIVQGMSIARYGDGELKIMNGHGCVSQDWDTRLQSELQAICRSTNEHCLIAIPTLDDRNPKFQNWWKLKERFERHTQAKKLYGSSFITRPDNAPWIDTKEYFDQMETLWAQQEVILVGNGTRSITKAFLEETGAARVLWIESSYKNSYREIDELERKIMAQPTKRVLLCVGPTATCLAYRLAQQEKHAIDLGHIGMFWRRYAVE